MPSKLVNQKQFRFPGGIIEMSTTVKNLDGKSCPVSIQLTYVAVGKNMGLAGRLKLNQVVAVIAVGIPDVVVLPEQMDKHTLWCLVCSI